MHWTCHHSGGSSSIEIRKGTCMSETGPWTFQIVDVFFGSHASTYSLYFECGYLDCLHCVSFHFSLYRGRFKIALKYLKIANLHRWITFKWWWQSNYRFVYMFFDCSGTDVNISMEEPKCLTCLWLSCNTVYFNICVVCMLTVFYH